MAWAYSNFSTLSGAARLAQLQLHIQEVTDRITEDYSTGAGQSKSVGSLEKYLESLQQQEIKLGGQAMRANGRSRLVQGSFADAGREGVQ